jgi:CheY-like chemotaxis protein
MKKQVFQILIVDDNADMLEIYRNMFQGEDRYEVDTQNDARYALRLIGEKEYDLVIMDVIMEPLSGEPFFVYLRSDERTMHIPVIAVTVLEPDMVETMKKLDHSLILQKPIRKKDLFEAIAKCLKLD